MLGGREEEGIERGKEADFCKEEASLYIFYR